MEEHGVTFGIVSHENYVVDYFSFHTKCRKLERVVFNSGRYVYFFGRISCDFLEYAPEKLTEDVKNGILLNAAK